MTPSPVDAVLLGAGDRGTFTFGQAALDHPDTVRFVAVAEPHPERRARFAARHGIPAERCFVTWQELLAAGQLAPALICCTLDRLHVAPAVAALHTGYHVLLEKPMAATPGDCVRIIQAQERTDRLLMIGHVLRYTPFFTALHDIITSGRLGDIVAVEHLENVAHWHMAHSYVRGNWSDAERASPMILTKCCHDLDILVWSMPGDPVVRLHSFGSLTHFRPEHAPSGAPLRCTDGCPATLSCPYDASRIYLTDDVGWPTETISVDLSRAARLHALQTGPYGRCVYRTDNTAVDHQVVTMEHESGAIVTLVMHGHSDEEERTIRWDGSRATLRARFCTTADSEITVRDHLTGALETVTVGKGDVRGHGGGDERLLRAFADAIRDANAGSLTSARTSLESHLLAFAAERSRLGAEPVDMPAYRAEVESEAVGPQQAAS
jgi:predicted dehydrogenase